MPFTPQFNPTLTPEQQAEMAQYLVDAESDFQGTLDTIIANMRAAMRVRPRDEDYILGLRNTRQEMRYNRQQARAETAG